VTRRIITRVAWLVGCVLLALTGACTHGTAPEPRTDVTAPSLLPGEDCAPFAGRPVRGGTLVVALVDSVQPAHAPVPHNPSERLVFRNLYETLVEVDCSGRPQPGLAVSWSSSPDYQTWIFTLRDHTRFWDGSRLDASDVKASWIGAESCPVTEGGHSPVIWLNPRAESVRALDARHLAIKLPEPQADLPLLLAHPALAVAVSRPGWTWPVGTGPCRPEVAAGFGPDLVCLPNPDHRNPPRWERITFRSRPGADPRDLLGSAADAMLVRDRGLLHYFEGSPGVTVTPLPWDRLYLLLCPLEGSQRLRERWYTGWQRADLARDVVEAEAQPVTEPYFQDPSEQLCPQMTGPVEALDWPAFSWEDQTASLDRDLILYPERDADARRLAERIAALAARPLRPGPDLAGRGPLTPPDTPEFGAAPQALGISALDFPGAVQSARAGAYILPLERCYATACLQFAALLGSADWLQRAALDLPGVSSLYPPGARLAQPRMDFELPEVTQAAQRLKLRGVVVSLVATRAFLVSKGRLAGVHLAYDGSPLLGGAGWAADSGSAP
jgi:hypothetical protein